MIRKCVVMMLMVMFVVAKVKCITPSQEFEPNKIKIPSLCELKCDALCIGHKIIGTFDKCVEECKKTRCSGQNQNIPIILN